MKNFGTSNYTNRAVFAKASTQTFEIEETTR